MIAVRPAALVSVVLATASLALTVEELSREPPSYFSWPNGPFVGALVLLSLVAALGWLVRDTRLLPSANAWAKSALALAISLPLAWVATVEIVRRKLDGLPDVDLPEGLADRMNADVLQTQIVALLVTMSVIVCTSMSARLARRI